jgi:hypothetical protein
MKFQAWILTVALAFTLGSAEAAAQSVKGLRAQTSATSSKGKTPAARSVPVESLGSAERRALLGGKSAAKTSKGSPAGKPGSSALKTSKPKVKS